MIYKHYKNFFKLRKLEGTKLMVHCFFAAVGTLLSIYSIHILESMIDSVSSKDMKSFLHVLPLASIVIVIGIIANYLKQTLLTSIQSNLTYELRNEMGKKQLYATLSSKQESNSGHIITVYQTQLPLIIDFMKNLQGYIIYPITVIIASVYFISISPILFVAAVVLMPLSTYVYGRLAAPIQAKRKHIVNKKAELTEETKDVLQGFTTMKSYQLEDYFIKRYYRRIGEILKYEKQLEHTNSILGRVFIILRFIPQLIIPLFGGYLAFTGRITLGEMTAANMIIGYIFGPIEQLLAMKGESKLLIPALEDVEGILSLSQEMYQSPKEYEQVEATNPHCILTMKDFSFSYEEGKEILSHVNLELKEKEHLVIVGESGSGKSTLIKAICGILEQYEGEIIIDNQQVTKENRPQLRNTIAYIPQRVYLFQGSILENIALEENFSKDKVYEAAKLARVDEYINTLPNGYDTVVGDGGFQLSGGQMQRIAIARGIYRDCNLFLLDEPTSALDEISEQSVMEGLRTIFKDKSSILITHRLGVISEEDKVLKLIGGMLYEA